MDENLSGKFLGQERMLGRRVLYVVPVLAVIVMVAFVFMALPVKYYFTVSGGQLCLMSGRMWVDAQRCQAIDPIPANDLNLQALTSQEFEDQSQALLVLREFFAKRVDEQRQKVSALEKELSAPYNILLRDLKAAKAAGMEGLEKNIQVLQDWTDFYKGQAQPK
jgi:hypothetical protein